jgi:preprotein translocase subunit Sss1
MDEAEKLMVEAAAHREEFRRILILVAAGMVGGGIVGYLAFTIKDVIKAIRDKTR